MRQPQTQPPREKVVREFIILDSFIRKPEECEEYEAESDE
jgi:hypothetical protein